MNTTRKHPRTLEEAFGPYARGPILSPSARNRREDRITTVACTLAALALVAILAIWG